MATAFVRAANNGASSGTFTAQSLSFDATSCNMLVVFTAIAGFSGTPSGISATYAGVSMTPVTGSPFATSGNAAILAFYLANPTTGVNNVSVSWTGSSTRAGTGAIGLSGAAGSVSSIQSTAGASGTVSSTAAVTSDTNSLVVAALVGGNGTADTFNTAGATNDFTQATTGFNYAGCHITGATSVTPSSATAETVMVGFSLPGLGFSGAGNFSLTGNAATFQAAEIIAQAAFALTGNAATFKITEPIVQASFSLTGNATTFQTAEPAAQASFALTGNSANLQTQLIAVQATFTETGNPVTILLTEAAGYGSFVLNGIAASGLNTIMAATYGSYQLVVIDATLKTTMEAWTPATSTNEVWTVVGIN